MREDESARIAASDHGANIRANPATDIVLKEFQQRQKRVSGGGFKKGLDIVERRHVIRQARGGVFKESVGRVLWVEARV